MTFAETRVKDAVQKSLDEFRRQLAMIPEQMHSDPWYKWGELQAAKMAAVLLSRYYGPTNCSACNASYIPHEIPSYGPLPEFDKCPACQNPLSPYYRAK